MLKKTNAKLVIFIAVPVAFAAVLLCYVLILHKKDGKEAEGEQVFIAVPYSERIENLESNYYTKWLENQSGNNITFLVLEEGYEKESLKAMLSSGNNNVDAVFFPAQQDIVTLEEYRDYAKKGWLLSPADYLSEDCNLNQMQEICPDTDFSTLYGEDGKLYCFPSMKDARTEKNMQILWINVDWLKRLDLALPKTTEEFYQVLCAFRDKDPNGNGIADEIPLVSCENDYALTSYPYLLNAFTYYDGINLSGMSANGIWEDESEEVKLRAGIQYCNTLYQEGLLSGACLDYTGRQLMELVNDPANTVGAFTSRSIADVIYTNNPDVLAHFVQLAPLSSEYQEKGYAVKRDAVPELGGIIPVNAKHKEAAAKIMDLMLSEEASLIALYGEEGVDWRLSKDGELSSYGTRTKITTIRYLKREIQNQNYAGMGPILVAAQFTDGVTWNGDHSMTEYIDARAVKAYEPYYRNVSFDDERADKTGYDINTSQEKDLKVKDYLKKEVLRFIVGEQNVENDSDWMRFLTGYGRLVNQ